MSVPPVENFLKFSYKFQLGHMKIVPQKSSYDPHCLATFLLILSIQISIKFGNALPHMKSDRASSSKDKFTFPNISKHLILKSYELLTWSLNGYILAESSTPNRFQPNLSIELQGRKFRIVKLYKIRMCIFGI